MEEPKQRAGVVQCHRCQNFGHSKSYCNHPPRCVKCSKTHLTSECQKPEGSTPKCVHCKGDHPANYSRCEVYLDLLKRRGLNQKVKATPAPVYVSAAPPKTNAWDGGRPSAWSQAPYISPLQLDDPRAFPSLPGSSRETPRPAPRHLPQHAPPKHHSPPSQQPQVSRQPSHIPTFIPPPSTNDMQSLLPNFLVQLQNIFIPIMNSFTTAIANLMSVLSNR